MLACVLIQPAQAQTVKLLTERTAEHPAIIFIKGQICRTMKGGSSALYEFTELAALQNEQTIVLLVSEGGSMVVAMEIGKIIQQRGFKTAVPDGERCSSACALIWLAGKERLLGRSAGIGFHSVRPSLTRFETSYRGNAAVEGYLAYTLKLPNPELAAFITKAPPKDMTWMTVFDAEDLKLEITQFNLSQPEWAWAASALMDSSKPTP